MQQTDLTVSAEIQLYYDLDIPEHASNVPLLIAVHGYGAHKGYMLREARKVVPDGWAMASLQGPHQHYRQGKDGGYRVGFGWLSDYKPEESVRLHHKFVLDVIEKLVADGVADRRQIYLYGFSQACALNFKFALTYPGVLKGIIGACGGIPGDLDSNPVYRPFDAKCFYLFGDDDEFYSQEQFLGFDARLRSLLPNYRSKHYTAKHEITDEMRADIKEWLSSL
jgi:predicted esterase